MHTGSSDRRGRRRSIMAILAALVLLAVVACTGGDGVGDGAGDGAGDGGGEAADGVDGDQTPPAQEPTGIDTGANTPAQDPDRPLRIVSVQHARCDWDSFWCTVLDGQNDAAAALGIEHTVVGPDAFDLNQVAALIDDAVAGRPDAIAVAVADPEILRAPIQAAVAAGIPVVAYNSGSDPATDGIDYLTFIGQDEYAGGLRGGERLIEAGGVGRGVCINQQVGQRALDRRCEGFADALAQAGSETVVLEISDDRAASATAVADFLAANPDVDMVLTLGPNSARPFYDATAVSDPSDRTIVHGTFDLGEEITAAIGDGRTLFGIDQQPYLQGFNSLAVLTNFLRYGLAPAAPITPTGPGFVTAETLSVEPDPDRPLRIVSVQHARCDWDAFWCPVGEGQAAAAAALGVEHVLLGPDEFDLEQVATLIDDAVASRPDGIAVTVTDPQVLGPSIQAALDAGIPVVAYNSGAGPRVDGLDYLTFFGQDDYAGGFQGGNRLIEAGGTTRGVCINQQVGQRSLDRRCNGFSDALNEAGIPVSVLEVTDDRATSASIIADFFAAHPDTDLILTLGPNAAGPFYDFAATALPDGAFRHGTFDLGEEIVVNIRSGRTLFGIDQQPYLQGYGSVVALTHLLRQGLAPASPFTATGPGFVTADNLGLVEALAGRYR